MPLARTDLFSTTNAGTGSATYVTGSFTPVDNSLLVICLSMGDAAVSGATVSINNTAGLVFGAPAIDFSEAAANFHRNVIWTAPVTTGVPMTVMVGTGSATAEYVVTAFSYTTYDTVTPVGATASGQTTTTGAVTITLSGTPLATSEVIGFDSSDTSSGLHNVTAGTGWSEQFQTSSGVGNSVAQTQTRTGSTSTAVLWNVASGGALAALVAIEIRQGSGVVASALPDVAGYVESDW